MTSSEKKRLPYLIAVLVIAVGVLATDRLGLLGDRSTASTEGDSTVASPRAPKGNARPNRSRPEPLRGERAAEANQESGVDPLPLDVLQGNPRTGPSPERNVFVYYVPPPPPPVVEPPPPPPPLTIRFVTPAQVFAGTGEFLLRVSGGSWPDGARIFVNGRALPTTVAGNSELVATIEKHMIANPGHLRVEVKDTTGELYSNVQTIIVRAPNKPTYKFLGRLDNRVYLQEGDQDRIEANLGDTVDRRWRVAGIQDTSVVLEDVAEAIGIRHSVALVEASSVAGGPIANPFEQNRFRPRGPIRPPRTTQNQNQDQNPDPDAEPNPDPGEDPRRNQ